MATEMSDDEWLKVAIVEDAVVAELLSSLKEPKATAPPSASTSLPEKPNLSFEWRVRQRRSKGVAVVETKKQPPRASPTTPLSWSGGATSISGGGCGGCAASGSGRGFEVEESSQLSPPPSAPKSSDIARSKVIGSCEVSAPKRIRKKNLTQLREEEVLLERERRQLKRELTYIRDNLERERTRNENFKRMKQQQQHASFNSISFNLPRVVVSNLGLIQQSTHNGYREGKMETAAGKFVLPDLNLTIEENHSGV